MKAINYLKRQKTIKEKLIEENIDLLMITPSVNFFYLFKGYFGISERLVCGIIDKDEDSSIIAPYFEKENMQIQTTFDDVITWKEEENPYLILKKSLAKTPRKIALEPTTPFETYIKLKNQFQDTKFVDGGPLVRCMRRIKSEEEIQRMKKAADSTANGIIDTLVNLKEGLTEIEILKIAQKEMSKYSGEMGWALVQIDENSGVPHGKPSDKKLKQNSVILIDAGTTCDHYFADITATSVFGKPSGEFLKVYDMVEKANDAALKESKARIPAEKVDFAARKVIEDAGYGKYFTHRLGHGLGLEVHEEPYIVKGNQEILVTGNVHTDEPGIYIPGKFGVRIEDDVLVTDKSERLVEFDRILWK